ncbi:uncharacterized protein PV09_04108 [Verruconis gallopava]|uniref:Uncharacterized protein n=1 Tax=Verruconis gallopava TaxID=253628 RepID=A0A0D2ADB9_9PEZI|nr:uncharacterized protein PV09_04108 [Verruconis gallopava]KIW04943.1 hypothetical protein PV09_04108 [Verruconis gallopava]
MTNTLSLIVRYMLFVSAPNLTTAFVTEFLPAPTCMDPPLSMFLNQENRVWINYPFPASGVTVSDCYPSDIIESLNTPFRLPATTPLSCPNWYTTATRYTGNYAVCCPLSYTLALAPTGAPASRPALSATCFSNLPSPTTVIAWDNVTITSTQGYNDPTAQAFALALDGFIANPTAQQTTQSSSNNAEITQPAITASEKPDRLLSGAAVAGVAAGGSVGLFTVVSAIVFFAIRYQRKADHIAQQRRLAEAQELDDEGRYWKNVLVKNVTHTRLELPAERTTRSLPPDRL